MSKQKSPKDKLDIKFRTHAEVLPNMMVRLKIDKILEGKSLENFLKKQSNEALKRLESELSKYDAESFLSHFERFIWYLDEFINLNFCLDDKDKELLYSLEIGDAICENPEHLLNAMFAVTDATNKETAIRLYKFLTLFWNTSIKDVGELLLYCKSRRLYYVSMLYLIPMMAKGEKKIEFEKIVEETLRIFEEVAVPVTSAFNALLVLKRDPGFEAVIKDNHLVFNRTYTQLENGFLEPVRLTELDMLLHGKDIDYKNLENFSITEINSNEEYEAGIKNMKVVFDGYKINELPETKELLAFAHEMGAFMEDGYHIRLTEEHYQSICDKYPHLILYKEPKDYFEVLKARLAFYRKGSNYCSNYFLIQRYVVNTTLQVLEKVKRFQIHSGFIFEKMVVRVLQQYGFQKVDVKRIDHKEFDVVCLKDGVVYNFQCKNNYYEVSEIDIKKIRRIAGIHKRMSKLYEEALQKEFDREDVLKEELKYSRVENFVISRFPIITNNKRVIAYNMLKPWLKEKRYEFP